MKVPISIDMSKDIKEVYPPELHDMVDRHVEEIRTMELALITKLRSRREKALGYNDINLIIADR